MIAPSPLIALDNGTPRRLVSHSLGDHISYFPYVRSISGSSHIDEQTTVSDMGVYAVSGTTNQGTAFQADGILIVGRGARLKIAANGKLGTLVNGSWVDK